MREQEWYEKKLQQENADLIFQTRSDPLTGLGNRRAFREAQETIQAQNKGAWVALIDIDHFKAINDTHGHAKGDEVLVKLGHILKQHAKGDHTVARLGGEEFAWLMPHVNEEEAHRQAENLREAVAGMVDPLPCTISIGLAAWQNLNDLDEALRRADEALFFIQQQTLVYPFGDEVIHTDPCAVSAPHSVPWHRLDFFLQTPGSLPKAFQFISRKLFFSGRDR